jgi:glycosyltransferase involved in cell wall biosynthesis
MQTGDGGKCMVKLSVVIPVYNEKDTVLSIIDRVQQVDLDKEIIVVDDGSTDGTRQLLQQLNLPDVRVLLHDRNRGKGAAVRTAVAQATGDYVIIQDADLEYDPSEYPRLLQPILEGSADVVYGSRFQGTFERMSFIHRIGNQALTVLTNWLYGSALTDMETCYKVAPTTLLQSLKLRSRGFEFEPEVTAKLLKHGCKIVEVPITYVAREVSEGKKINWRHGIPALLTLLRYRIFD